MRVLVLGGTGMLGHTLAGVLAPRFDTWTTVRSAALLGVLGWGRTVHVMEGVDAMDFSAIQRQLEAIRPAVVVNCVGVIKQLDAAKDPVACLTLNSLLPQRVAAWCRGHGVRFMHISTDCVFSGRKGGYKESDVPDADDLYGRSKLLGEVASPGALTLRTSIIGRELGSAHGLLEWFRAQEGKEVKGFTRAVFSGLPTVVLSETIARLIERHEDLSGLYHVSADPIDKYSLLELFRATFGCRITVRPDANLQVDRSLDSARFRAQTGITFPGWPELVKALAASK